MSTRACYVFKHEGKNHVGENAITIYKHHDGYPAGAISWIKAAKDYGNKLPTDEFGENLNHERDKMVTGFMACPEITNSAKWFTDNYKDHGDLSYHYVIYGDSMVEIWQHKYYVVGDKIEDKVELIFLGSIDEAVKKYVPTEEVA